MFTVASFSAKLIVMDFLLFQKTVNMIFSDRCAQNFFFTRKLMYFPSMDFLTQTCRDITMFNLFASIF